ncbi:hypothetical protein [Mangrovibacterium lignilyticum]|uniref:hypothetical protein n=1 Tax=Mangrovibacterium lignilyticum TaxID=2668052 RepID=UPI0013D1C509|nr:hypothetical protein [Mangrovibacterium lignilyticum]
MIGKFFHTPRAKRFNITTRYYDQEKEELKDREDRIKAELGMNEKKEWDPNHRANIRGQFRNTMGGFSKSAEESRRKSNTRLIFFILILSLAVYLILKF